MSVLAGILFTFLAASFVFAHGTEEEVPSGDTASTQDEQIHLCSLIPATDERDACYASLCGDDPQYLCVEDVLTVVVSSEGPERAIAVLELFDPSVGTHQLAHVIGRETSKQYGITGQTFLWCPTQFEYGCRHGFFEYASSQMENPTDAMTAICESIPDESYDDKFYCYHGIGHGVTMAESYNLDTSLATCDLLDEEWRNICWDGVFMENLQGFFTTRDWGTAKSFRRDDPLAPCSRLDAKYKTICYQQHAAYLFDYYDDSLEDIIDACSKVEEVEGKHGSDCVKGVAGIIPQMLDLFSPDHSKGVAERVIQSCTLFPTQYEQDCYVTAAFVVVVFYGFEVGVSYCKKLDDTYQEPCFRSTFNGLRRTVDAHALDTACTIAPPQYLDACLYGDVRGYDAQNKPPGASLKSTGREDKPISNLMQALMYIFRYVASLPVLFLF